MVHGRVDVGVEAVLLGGGLLPGRLRLLGHEADAHDGLGALEAVLPRDHDPDGRAVLVRQHLAVHAHREERERVHRLVEAEPLDIGPVEASEVEEPLALAGELLGVQQRRELHEARLARGLDPLEQRCQRIADPRDDHGPALHAAERVDALLERGEAEDLLDVEALGLRHEAVHLHAPGTRPQRPREPRGVFLVDAELVEVVVGGRALDGRGRLGQAQRRIALGRERLPRGGRRRRRAARGEHERGGPGHERAPAEIEPVVRDLRARESAAALDQHGRASCGARVYQRSGGRAVTAVSIPAPRHASGARHYS